jgi:hypothetical protein
MPSNARLLGIVKSRASLSETNPTFRALSSCNVAMRSTSDLRQRSSRHTTMTSIFGGRRVATSRRGQVFAPEPTSSTVNAICQHLRSAFIHARLDQRPRLAPADQCRPQQGRGAQRPCPCRVLPSLRRNPRPDFRKPALPCLRPQSRRRRQAPRRLALLAAVSGCLCLCAGTCVVRANAPHRLASFPTIR